MDKLSALHVKQAAPATLDRLLQDLRVARDHFAVMRAAPLVQSSLLTARHSLLRAMGAYAEGLTARRLPIPPRLRDEMRLLRDMRQRP
jgi:hypothetical protein